MLDSHSTLTATDEQIVRAVVDCVTRLVVFVGFVAFAFFVPREALVTSGCR